MTATFPGAVKDFSTKYDGADLVQAAHINDLQDEVMAVEAELLKTSGSVVDHGALSGLSDDDHPLYVDNINNESIAGVKTFTSFPITPSSAPTTNYQVSNKKYVNDSISALNLVSGSYTPTFTNVSNIASVTPYQAQYMRVGNVVTVSGAVAIACTSASGSTSLRITLPIASNLAVLSDLAGTGATANSNSARLYADATNNEALLIFATDYTSQRTWAFHFSYIIV